ncbi:hypothetical protein PS1_037726 [Malus domestica]
MARQARKAGYEVDPDDIRVVEAVKPVLAELEKGVAPGKVDSEDGFENSSQKKKRMEMKDDIFYLRLAAPSSGSSPQRGKGLNACLEALQEGLLIHTQNRPTLQCTCRRMMIFTCSNLLLKMERL